VQLIRFRDTAARQAVRRLSMQRDDLVSAPAPEGQAQRRVCVSDDRGRYHPEVQTADKWARSAILHHTPRLHLLQTPCWRGCVPVLVRISREKRHGEQNEENVSTRARGGSLTGP
jgi:hypothetical protein